jgi:hypothetical protein
MRELEAQQAQAFQKAVETGQRALEAARPKFPAGHANGTARTRVHKENSRPASRTSPTQTRNRRTEQ